MSQPHSNPFDDHAAVGEHELRRAAAAAAARAPLHPQDYFVNPRTRIPPVPGRGYPTGNDNAPHHSKSSNRGGGGGDDGFAAPQPRWPAEDDSYYGHHRSVSSVYSQNSQYPRRGTGGGTLIYSQQYQEDGHNRYQLSARQQPQYHPNYPYQQYQAYQPSRAPSPGDNRSTLTVDEESSPGLPSPSVSLFPMPPSSQSNLNLPLSDSQHQPQPQPQPTYPNNHNDAATAAPTTSNDSNHNASQDDNEKFALSRGMLDAAASTDSELPPPLPPKEEARYNKPHEQHGHGRGAGVTQVTTAPAAVARPPPVATRRPRGSQAWPLPTTLDPNAELPAPRLPESVVGGSASPSVTAVMDLYYDEPSSGAAAHQGGGGGGGTTIRDRRGVGQQQRQQQQSAGGTAAPATNALISPYSPVTNPQLSDLTVHTLTHLSNTAWRSPSLTFIEPSTAASSTSSATLLPSPLAPGHKSDGAPGGYPQPPYPKYPPPSSKPPQQYTGTNYGGSQPLSAAQRDRLLELKRLHDLRQQRRDQERRERRKQSSSNSGGSGYKHEYSQESARAEASRKWKRDRRRRELRKYIFIGVVASLLALGVIAGLIIGLKAAVSGV